MNSNFWKKKRSFKGTISRGLIILTLIFTSTDVIAYSENIQVLKSKFETQFSKEKSFKLLLELVEIYLIETKYKEAEQLLKSFSIKQLSSIDKGYYFLSLAKTYKYEQNNELALLNFHKAEEIFEKNNNYTAITKLNIELLEFYRKTADFERAFKTVDKLQQVLKVESYSDDQIKIQFYNRYAAVVNEQARPFESIVLSKKAILLAQKIKDYYAQAISFNELGFSYKNIGNKKLSLFYYDKAYRLWLSLGSYREAIHVRYNYLILKAHNELISYEEQIVLFKDLIKKIDSLKIDYPKKNIYFALEFPNIHLNNWKEAHLYRKLADSITTVDNTKTNLDKIYEIKEKYENDKLNDKNKSIQKLSIERKKRIHLVELRFWLIFVFLVFVGVLTAVLFYLYRKNKTQNKLLLEQNKQKTFLIQEVHHRVKNNLQFMKSVLVLQQSVDELSAKETIEDITRRIDAVSMVHEMLYTDNPGINLSVRDYIEKLISISSSFYTSEKKIEFNLQIEPILLPIEKLISIGIICSELLANSVKHVLTENQILIFNVQLFTVGDQIQVNIQDNGRESINLIEDKRFKLGMRIIEIFSKKLNATPVISSESNYNFSISFSKE